MRLYRPVHPSLSRPRHLAYARAVSDPGGVSNALGGVLESLSNALDLVERLAGVARGTTTISEAELSQIERQLENARRSLPRLQAYANALKGDIRVH